MTRITARRPYNDHHAPAEVADRLDAKLSLIAPQVRNIDRQAGEDLSRVFEIHAALAQSPIALRRVVRDPQFMYPQKLTNEGDE